MEPICEFAEPLRSSLIHQFVLVQSGLSIKSKFPILQAGRTAGVLHTQRVCSYDIGYVSGVRFQGTLNPRRVRTLGMASRDGCSTGRRVRPRPRRCFTMRSRKLDGCHDGADLSRADSREPNHVGTVSPQVETARRSTSSALNRVSRQDSRASLRGSHRSAIGLKLRGRVGAALCDSSRSHS